MLGNVPTFPLFLDSPFIFMPIFLTKCYVKFSADTEVLRNLRIVTRLGAGQPGFDSW
jgi:hypothetical protein